MRTLRLLWMFIATGVAAGQTTTPVTPMFAPPSGYAVPAGASPRSVAVGDFNGDQISDVAVVNPYSGTVTVLLGSLTGALVPPVNPATNKPYPPVKLAVGAMPTSVAAGYFMTNAQGPASTTLDLAVTSILNTTDVPGTVTILIGDGTGNFNPTATVTVGKAPSAIAVSDLDGDGNFDLAVANAGDGNVSILFGDGNGNFAPKYGITTVPVGNHPAAIAAGNFNGFSGLAVANQMDGSVTLISLVPVFDGTGAFMTYSAMTSPAFPVMAGLINPPFPYPSGIAVADVNGDGFPDVVTANDGTNNVSVLLGDGRGGFTYAVGSPIPVGGAPTSVVTADFNGDGIPDLAVANYTSGNVSVLLGTGTGGFTTAAGSPYASGESTVSVAVGDFNGAGRASLTAVNEIDNTVTILLNGATPPMTVVSGGSFTAPVSPGSLISILGSGLASSTATSTSTPTTFVLGNASVVITYNNNVQDVLGLSMASPTQVNAVIPANNTAGGVNPVPGLATVSVVMPSKTQTAQVEIAPLAPALLSANGTGKGVANATFLAPGENASVTIFQPCSTATPPVCVPVPIDLSHGGKLTLTATGLNNAASATVTVGGESVETTPVPQPNAPGTYLLTAALLKAPPLRGFVPVVITISNQGKVLVSNAVSVLIQ